MYNAAWEGQKPRSLHIALSEVEETGCKAARPAATVNIRQLELPSAAEAATKILGIEGGRALSAFSFQH